MKEKNEKGKVRCTTKTMLLLVIGLALWLTACTPKGGGSSTGAAGNENQPYAGQTVSVLLEDTAWHRNIQNTIGDFQSHTGIKVTLEFMPEVQSREKVNLDLTSGTGMYDVFLADEMYFQKFAKLGSLEPLDSYLDAGFDKNDFPEKAIETCTINGKLYAIPWRAQPNVLFYRTDILEKYNLKVPKTYDELYVEAVKARKALAADGQNDVYGITARGIKGEGLNMWIVGSSILPAFGASWLDASGKPSVNHPKFVQAIEYYAKLLQDAGPPDAASQNWDDCFRIFEQGKAVFLLDGLIFGGLMHADGGYVAENFGVTLVPIGPEGNPHPGLYCPSYVMNTKAKNKGAAWEFIKFATSYEQMLSDAVDGGNFEIARISIFDSSEFAAQYNNDLQLINVGKESKKWAKEERPMIIAWPQVGDIVGEVVQSAIAGQLTAQAALDDAQRRIMEIYNDDPESFK
jgi:multiple sugar transport system substrate-binding protein